jgi:hypothetical protein
VDPGRAYTVMVSFFLRGTRTAAGAADDTRLLASMRRPER